MQTPLLILALIGLVLIALAFMPIGAGMVGMFCRALGLQALLVLPVGIVQTLALRDVNDFPNLLGQVLASTLFNMGGLLSASSYESIAQAGLMHQTPHALGVVPDIYFPLMIVQAFFVAGSITTRARIAETMLRDQKIRIVMGLVFVNSVLSITWPWWAR